MPTAYFSGLDDGDVIQVEFAEPDGGVATIRLFVDSGFTGDSALILSEKLSGLALANVSAAHASGALQGRQRRILVDCRIPAITFQRNVVAIVTDVESLSLPQGVEGMAGLSFLRQFNRWGGERLDDGRWRFLISQETD